jgi:hypothetical protein
MRVGAAVAPELTDE